jgi:hypothetical protein
MAFCTAVPIAASEPAGTPCTLMTRFIATFHRRLIAE